MQLQQGDIIRHDGSYTHLVTRLIQNPMDVISGFPAY